MLKEKVEYISVFANEMFYANAANQWVWMRDKFHISRSENCMLDSSQSSEISDDLLHLICKVLVIIFVNHCELLTESLHSAYP